MRAAAASVSRARALMAQVDRDFGNTQAALRALATSRMLQTGDLAGFHQRADDVLNNLNADSILLLAPDGQFLLSTWRPYGSLLYTMAVPVRRGGVVSYSLNATAGPAIRSPTTCSAGWRAPMRAGWHR